MRKFFTLFAMIFLIIVLCSGSCPVNSGEKVMFSGDTAAGGLRRIRYEVIDRKPEQEPCPVSCVITAEKNK